MRKIIFLFLLVIIAAYPLKVNAACGGSFTSCGVNCVRAYDCSRDCVTTALSELTGTSGTVQVPAGSCTWTSAITMPSNKSWILQGDSSLSTHIKASGNNLITVPSMPGKTWRITGLNFIGPAGSGNNAWLIIPTGYISETACSSFQIDNNIFNDCNAAQTAGCVKLGGVCYGVVDHNQFLCAGANKCDIDLNAPDVADWAAPVNLGSANAVYIEDNYFEHAANARYLSDGSEHNWLFIDSTSGGRYVARYNVFKNGYVAGHGSCYNAGVRGTVLHEVYNNWVYHETGVDCGGSSCDLFRGIHALSGTGLVANNVIEGDVMGGISFGNNRSESSCNFGAICDGNSPLDMNTKSIDMYKGYPCLDQPGVIGAQNNQTLKPIYVWGNRKCDTVSSVVADCKTNPKGCVDEAYAKCGTALSTIIIDGSNFAAYHFKENRDYYLTSHPTWSPYTYPHPLSVGGSIIIPMPPKLF